MRAGRVVSCRVSVRQRGALVVLEQLVAGTDVVPFQGIEVAVTAGGGGNGSDDTREP